MLRPRRSSFHTTSVSPFPRVLSTRFSPGRSEVFPLILSSNISSHPAHSSAVRCNAVFWSFVDTLTYPISMVLFPAKGSKHATGELDGHSQKCWFGNSGNEERRYQLRADTRYVQFRLVKICHVDSLESSWWVKNDVWPAISTYRCARQRVPDAPGHIPHWIYIFGSPSKQNIIRRRQRPIHLFILSIYYSPR